MQGILISELHFIIHMDAKQCSDLLQKHGIGTTANRIVIVKALAESDGPQSMRELETRILTIDKSVLSRTLALFRKNHLVHTLEDGDGNMKFELCLSHDDEIDDDEHVHFFCEKCHKTYCLHGTPLPAVNIPEGFTVNSANYMLIGVCEKCK